MYAAVQCGKTIIDVCVWLEACQDVLCVRKAQCSCSMFKTKNASKLLHFPFITFYIQGLYIIGGTLLYVVHLHYTGMYI